MYRLRALSVPFSRAVARSADVCALELLRSTAVVSSRQAFARFTGSTQKEEEDFRAQFEKFSKKIKKNSEELTSSSSEAAEPLTAADLPGEKEDPGDGEEALAPNEFEKENADYDDMHDHDAEYQKELNKFDSSPNPMPEEMLQNGLAGENEPPNPVTEADEELLNKAKDEMDKAPSEELKASDQENLDNDDEENNDYGDKENDASLGKLTKAKPSSLANDVDDAWDKEKKPVEPTEKVTGSKRVESFQTETRQLLDIVAHSLYTDKEVFLRELISNASDALEKLRYTQQVEGDTVSTDDQPLKISIWCDENAGTLTLQDNGIGMSGDELIDNLGTIARSGSKAFMKNLSQGNQDSSKTSNIIGQFGVGFYATFMVANRVEVYSRSAKDDKAHYWSSNGAGQYEIAEADGVQRGTKIVLHLKKESLNFSKESELARIVKKHSSFVGFPLTINGEDQATVGALWLQNKSNVSQEQHTAFYKHIASSYEEPRAHFHFNTDVPLAINALFYIPLKHQEKYGMGRENPGVHLYSRKILIQANNKHILPDWLRFVKGVVDSEDIPLNISRETMQDSQLIKRINSVLAKRIIRFLSDQARNEPEIYSKFFEEFGPFLKEGACTDQANQSRIAPLLRFDSSLATDGKFISLGEYVSRMPLTQKHIYFMTIPNRQLALSSPYLEAFKAKGTEVLFLYREVDEVVMNNMTAFENRKFKNVQESQIDAQDVDTKAPEQESAIETEEITSAKRDIPLFFSSTLGSRVCEVTVSDRLVSSPALVTDTESVMMRKMMSMVDGAVPNSMGEKRKLQINVKHPIVSSLNTIRLTDAKLAATLVEQIYDNALVSAGILDDPRCMLTRVNQLMERLVENETGRSVSPGVTEAQMIPALESDVKASPSTSTETPSTSTDTPSADTIDDENEQQQQAAAAAEAEAEKDGDKEVGVTDEASVDAANEALLDSIQGPSKKATQEANQAAQ